MKSEWKTYRGYLDERTVYGVYRLKNAAKNDVFSNREYDDDFNFVTDAKAAQERADKLNGKDKPNEN